MALRSKNVSLIINVLAVNCNLKWLQQWSWIQHDNDRIGMSLNISERVHLKGNVIYIITNTIVGTKYTSATHSQNFVEFMRESTVTSTPAIISALLSSSEDA